MYTHSTIEWLESTPTYIHTYIRRSSLFPRKDVSLSFVDVSPTPMRSDDHVGRTSRAFYFFFPFFSNVAGIGAYVKYRRELEGMKICWLSCESDKGLHEWSTITWVSVNPSCCVISRKCRRWSVSMLLITKFFNFCNKWKKLFSLPNCNTDIV